MKKHLSAAAALALTVSMAASAAATDYAANPSYPLPPAVPSAPSGTAAPVSTSSSAGTALSNPASLIDKQMVSRALRTNSPVYASYTDAGIKANALASLALKKDSVLTVITKRYTAVIKGESVTKAKDISLAIKMTKSSDHGALILRTEQKGDFGCTADIYISSKYYSQCGVDLKNAHVYFIDDNKKVNDLGGIVLDDDGNIVVSMTSGGKYIIM